MAKLSSDDEDYSQQRASFTGVLRASGKRFRRQFNPNNWEKSILTIRHNVLCLGMSYPCVETVIANYKPPGSKKKSDIKKNKKAVKIFHSAPSVERSVELVRRNLLNQIDGRDLARVVALEANNDILAYTISMEQGAYYDQRHLYADFNNRTLIQQMHRRWGSTVKFRQVILDYFWSPSGSWAQKHWQKSFFNENIPRLVTEKMLNFGDLENDTVFMSSNENTVHDEDYITSTAAVVYLPFGSHCLSQVVACYDNLSQYYTIAFLRKDQLEEHTLWKATNTICAESMRGWLAKTINQEEIYCKLDARQIKHGTGDHSVTKEEILDVFNKIDRPEEVRMIKLTALRKFHPEYSKSDMHNARATLGLNKGGYVGLVSKRPANRRKSADMNVGEIQAADTDAPEIRIDKQIASRKQDDIDRPKQKQRGKPRKKSISSLHLDKHDQKQSKPRPISGKRTISPVSQRKLDKLVNRKKAKTADGRNAWRILANSEVAAANNEVVEDVATSTASIPTETTEVEEPRLSLIALEWESIMSSLELEYQKQHEMPLDSPSRRQSTIEDVEYAGQIQPPQGNHRGTAQEKRSELIYGATATAPLQTTVSTGNDSPSAPIAMRRIAKLRRSIGGRTSEAKAGSEALNDGKSIANELCTQSVRAVQSGPSANDVLMGVNHHTHPGNMQFFNALLMCAHDFSEVADCFVDALKSMNPPGRFLAKNEICGSWDRIDYDDAVNYVHYLADIHALKSCTSMGSKSDSSSVFLNRVQRNFDNKFNPVEHRIRQLSEVSLSESGLHFLDESCGTSNEPSMSSTIESAWELNKNDVPFTRENEAGDEDISSTCGETSSMVDKINSSVHPSKKRHNEGISSKAARALAEYEETEKIGTLTTIEEYQLGTPFTVGAANGVSLGRQATKNNPKKRRPRKGKSAALALALSELEDADKLDAKEQPEREYQMPSPSSTSVASGSVTELPVNVCEPDPAFTGLDMPRPIMHNSPCNNNMTTEEASLKRLAQWLQSATGNTRGGESASMENSLKQVSEQGNISMCKLLAQALDEEEASLRSLYTS